MKTRELKSYNLMSNRSYNEALDAKPYVLLYILFFFGIGLVLFSEYVFGVAVIFFSASCILFLPQRVLIEFYDEYMIAYNKANKDECTSGFSGNCSDGQLCNKNTWLFKDSL